MTQPRTAAPAPPPTDGEKEEISFEQLSSYEHEFLRIRDRMTNLEKRYLNQDGKLDAILNRQTEYRLDMKTFHDKITEELESLKKAVETFGQFSWFIETINKWRNNLFWGVAKLVILAICLFAFATNCESMKSALKKMILGT